MIRDEAKYLGIHVPAQWPKVLPTKIAFVGEAPSWDEVEGERPLIGPSGKLFNTMMRTAGLDRNEYLVTNVFDEKIPENQVKNWCVTMKEARENGWTDLPPIGAAGFLRPEYRHHLSRLYEELEAAQPSVVVPLGGTALWALLGRTDIGGYRGTVASSTRAPRPYKLVPTYHPAFVMKQFKFYTVVVKDLIKAKEEADRGPEVKLPNRTLILEPTLFDIDGYMPRIERSSLLAVDIETWGPQITCIGFAPDAEHAICIPFFDRREPDHSYWRNPTEEFSAWRAVQHILASPVPKLGQNFVGYDFYRLLDPYHLAVRNLLHDTRLMQHARYPELPKSLSFMGNSYGSQGAWKHWGKHGAKRDD